MDEIVGADDEYFLVVTTRRSGVRPQDAGVNAYRGSIAEDIKLLQQFGVVQKHDVGQGLAKRLSILFGNMASVIAAGECTLDDCLPIIEYVAAGKVPMAWLYLADLCEERLGDPDEYVRSCLV